MNHLIYLLSLSFIFFIQSYPNETESEKAILKPIHDLFTGFRTSDSSLVASAFYDRSPFLGSSFVRDGKTLFRKDANGLQGILNAVTVPKADSVKWDERIFNLEINVDDGLASVYAPYRFYIGKTFSHCGVNFFNLVLTDKGWKILSIVDTRRKNCD
jgi:hypothetical protein